MPEYDPISPSCPVCHQIGLVYRNKRTGVSIYFCFECKLYLPPKKAAKLPGQ